jgi:hypothetical protein
MAINIGDAIGGGATVGSVLFVGAGTLLAQDNFGFYFDPATNTLKTKDQTNSDSASFAVGTGDVGGSSTGGSGALTIETGDGSPNLSASSTAGNSGAITVQTGAGGNADNGSLAGNSGNLNLETGNGGGNVFSGFSGGSAGHIVLQPGSGGSGPAGTGAGGSTLVRASNSGDILAVQNSAGTTTHMAVNNSGNMRIGTSSSAARLHLGAGTTSLPPLKFDSGSLLTSLATGTLEWDGSEFYRTNANGRRPLGTSLEIANVLDFGAKGDGTDDKAAFQAAVTSLVNTGGVVWVPPGKIYGLASMVTIQSQHPIWIVSRMGGWNNSHDPDQGSIRPIAAINEPADAMFKWVKVGSAINTAGSGGVIGLKFIGAASYQAAYPIHSAIRLENGPNFLMQDCQFYNLQGRVFYAGEWAISTFIERIDVAECGASGKPMIDLQTAELHGYFYISDSELEICYGAPYIRVPVGMVPGVFLHNVGFEADHNVTADQTFVDASEGRLRADNCEFRRNQATHVIIGKATGENYTPGHSSITNSFFAAESGKTTPTLHVLATAAFCQLSGLKFFGVPEQVGRQIHIEGPQCQLVNVDVRGGGNIDIAAADCCATNIHAVGLITTETHCIKITHRCSLIGCNVNGSDGNENVTTAAGILATGFTSKVIGCEVKNLVGENAHGIEASTLSIVEGNSVAGVGGRAYVLLPGCSAKNNIGNPEELVFASTAISNSVTNTTVETDFNQTYTIPRYRLIAGDVIRVRGYVKVTAANANDTLQITVKLGATNVASTGPIDVSAGDAGYFDLQLHVRAAGASGTFVGTGLMGMGPPTNQTAPKIERRDATTIDTTQDIVVKATALWSAASAGNACQLELFSVELISYNLQ